MTETTTTPKTRAEAIKMLVEQDVAKWGEDEREEIVSLHSDRSYGRALNELANRAELAGTPNPDLRAAAKAALSTRDVRDLRQGG